MNRKTFLQRSALLALATAGLPRLAKARPDEKPDDRYVSEKVGSNPALAYIFFLPAGGTDPVNKDMAYTMNLLRYETDSATPTKSEYRFKRAGKVKQKVGEPDILTLKKEALVSGNDVLPGSFPKSPELKVTIGESILLETSKKNFVLLKYSPVRPEGDEEDYCFLTTACTASRNLPDNCSELTTLRQYRDSFLRPTADGLDRIREYYRIAPPIVKAINARSNSAEIWDHLYNTLVVPSVSLIEAGKLEEAGAWYGDYVADLKEVFMPQS